MVNAANIAFCALALSRELEEQDWAPGSLASSLVLGINGGISRALRDYVL